MYIQTWIKIGIILRNINTPPFSHSQQNEGGGREEDFDILLINKKNWRESEITGYQNIQR